MDVALTEMSAWFRENKLAVNPSKCELQSFEATEKVVSVNNYVFIWMESWLLKIFQAM